MSQEERTFNPGDRLVTYAEMPPGETRVLKVEAGERPQEIILARTELGFRAYQNRCRHLPVSLDWGDGEVLDESGDLLQCRTHGALYRIEDGLCVAGPCKGHTLIPVEVEERGQCVYLKGELGGDCGTNP
jgi:nitrite reductase/ring-hydroxylating ferredoxin subunit